MIKTSMICVPCPASLACITESKVYFTKYMNGTVSACLLGAMSGHIGLVPQKCPGACRAWKIGEVHD